MSGLVVLTTFVAASGAASACSCVGLTDEEALRNSAAVFVGTLREIRRPTIGFSSDDPSRFVFDVEAVYKGRVHQVQSIVSASDGASCGLEVAEGERALVFAHAGGESSMVDGEYAAGLCGGTRVLGTSPAPTMLGAPIEVIAGNSTIGEDDSLPSVLVRNWSWVVGLAVVLVGVVIIRRRGRHGPTSTSE